MKILPLFAISAVFCSAAFGSAVTVDGEEFYLASGGKNEAETIREFLPKGQGLDEWTRLVSIRQIPGQNSPKAYIAALAQTYHTNYPHMKFAAGGADDEWFIDFIAFPSGKVARPYVEWDFFVARKDPKQGVVVAQYAVRYYAKDADDDPFKSFDVRGLRMRMVEKLKKEKFEVNESAQPASTSGLQPQARR
jgi:hypothetical protein